MNVVCIGDCGVDRYLPSGPVLCGGITANFALQARAVFPGSDTITIISATGNDDAAAVIHERLANSGIDCRFTTLEGPSPVQYIETEADGEKKFVRYDEGVLRDFRLNAGNEQLIAASGLLVVPVFRQIYDFFDRVMAIENAGFTAVDFADFARHPDFSLLDRYLDSIDIAFFGLSVGANSLIDEIESRAESHGKLLVVTLGAGGSLAFCGDESFSCAAMPVDEVVDTTGAGDAFAAGFLSQYCYGKSISASLHKGASLSAKIIQQMGAN